jgi:hypothetical protein
MLNFLKIGLAVALILAAVWYWSSTELNSDGKAAHAVFDKIIEQQPKLKVVYHEKEGYFPCLSGVIDGIDVHIHHEYQARRKNRAGYLFVTFWGKNQLANKKHWFSLATSHSKLLDSEKMELRKFAEAAYNEKFQLRDREDDFALKIFDNSMMEQLSESIKDGQISIFLDEGNLKFMRIDFFNAKDEAAIKNFSQLINTGVNIYKKALEIDAAS